MLPKHDWLVKSVLQNGALKLAWQAKLDLGDSGAYPILRFRPSYFWISIRRLCDRLSGSLVACGKDDRQQHARQGDAQMNAKPSSVLIGHGLLEDSMQRGII